MNTTATNEQSPIDNKKALRRAVIELIANGRHQLFILAYDLDPLIYSNNDFTQQLSALARRSKRPDIRILLHRPTRLLNENHRALAVIQRLSSLIEVRQLHEQYTEQWHSYVISDQPAMLYQATYERYDATLTIETRNIAEHRKQFKQMWQRSDIATQLRRQLL